MDEINSTWFAYTDPADPSRVRRGFVRVVPGLATSDTVLCELVDPDSEWQAFECTEASAAIDEEDVTIYVDFEL